MSTTPEVLAAIRQFSELARRSRLEGLTPEDQTTMDNLEEVLRPLIGGTPHVPRPQRTPQPTTPAPQPATPAGPTEPIARDGTDPPRAMARSAAATPQAKLTPEDAQKVHTVATRDLPASPYAPPTGSLFLANYYDADLTPATVDKTDDIIDVVDPTGTRVDLDREVQVLLGVEAPRHSREPKPATRVPRSTAPAPAVRPDLSAAPPATREPGRPEPPPSESPPGQPGRRAVLVHLVTGGTVRGSLEAFEPTAPTVTVTARSGQRVPVTTRDILAVFFGKPRGQPPAERAGQPLVITMINGRQLRGRSSDYVPGGATLTLVLDPPHQKIDHVWVPAWAVRGIDHP